MSAVTSPPLAVAVDGPSGSGKSSVARGVARRFGYRYLDTGAMYRAVTWYVLERGFDPADGVAVAALLTEVSLVSGTDPEHPGIQVNGVDVSEPIRGRAVTDAVSAVSAVPEVRAFLVRQQRLAAKEAQESGSGIVVEGRDIGAHVLPHADVKVFLTADPAVRAERRALQDSNSAHGSHGVTATHDSLLRRDELDSSRTASPMRQADGAVVVDATHLDLPATIDAVAALVVAAGGRPRD